MLLRAKILIHTRNLIAWSFTFEILNITPSSSAVDYQLLRYVKEMYICVGVIPRIAVELNRNVILIMSALKQYQATVPM